jgi:hypothetical protein
VTSLPDRSWIEDLIAAHETWSRAPSAHNTQPGIVRPDGDSVVIDWDPARELVIADPTRRDLWLSLGALAECLVIAAGDLGHTLGVDWQVDARRHRAARLTRRSSAVTVEAPFTAEDLRARRTARGAYVEPRVTGREVAAVTAAADLPAEQRLDILPIDLVKTLLPQADAWSFGSTPQVDELRSWLRLSPSHPAYRSDGLTDTALALSRSEARALETALQPPLLGCTPSPRRADSPGQGVHPVRARNRRRLPHIRRPRTDADRGGRRRPRPPAHLAGSREPWPPRPPAQPTHRRPGDRGRPAVPSRPRPPRPCPSSGSVDPSPPPVRSHRLALPS